MYKNHLENGSVFFKTCFDIGILCTQNTSIMNKIKRHYRYTHLRKVSIFIRFQQKILKKSKRIIFYTIFFSDASRECSYIRLFRHFLDILIPNLPKISAGPTEVRVTSFEAIVAWFSIAQNGSKLVLVRFIRAATWRN